MKADYTERSGDTPIVCSFSGGETSAYMAIRLKEKYGDSVAFVFANTGQENEKTLIFADRIDKEYSLNLVWIEAKINPEYGKGTGYRIVNFDTASRRGEPFEEMIKVYGIPNTSWGHCTRELKQVPLTKYKKDFYGDCFTAIGIRSDEIDRVSSQYKKNRLIYPLIDEFPTTKNEVNRFWREQPFRLDLKHYQGNCKWCFKKSFSKLAWIMKEAPEAFNFPERMEAEYGDARHKRLGLDGEARFFRKNKSVSDIREMAKTATEPIDDARIYHVNRDLFGFDHCGSESCEAFQ